MNTEPESLAISGRGLGKTFRDFWGRPKVIALREVDIGVPRGIVFGLLGPNGAGKSTLIKLILGHLYPTAGRLAVFDCDPRDVAVKQRLGYLPERSCLYRNLTAAETLRYFGSLVNLSREQVAMRQQQLLEMVGLEGVGNRLVGEFSHGMTRRLGLAQALLNDPDLLILDEPTAGLDPVGCREVKDLVITLGKRGKTVLLTSHQLADVEDVCDDIMLLFGGRVQASGSVRSLLRDEDRVRLEFPRIDDRRLAAVTQLLKESVPAGELQQSAPSESLESYFLKVVTESHSRHQETGGARMGGGVAAYLREGGQAEDLGAPEVDAAALQQLSRRSPELTEPPAAASGQADTATLDELTMGPTAPAPDADDNDQVDRDALDELTR